MLTDMPQVDAPVIALKMLLGNEPTHLNAFQSVLAPFVHEIAFGWLCVWGITALVLLVRLAREYRAHRAAQSV